MGGQLGGMGYTVSKRAGWGAIKEVKGHGTYLALTSKATGALPALKHTNTNFQRLEI